MSFELDWPPPKALIMREELDLLLMASSRYPQNIMLRAKAAKIAVTLDQFDEALSLIQDIKTTDDNKFSLAITRTQAYLAMETHEGNLMALQSLLSAKENAPNNMALAEILADLGKVHVRLGDPEKAVSLLQRALDYNPLSSNAFKRWAAIDFRAGRESVVLKRCNDFISKKIINSRLLADRYISLELLGHAADAEQLLGLNTFFLSKDMVLPQGGNWQSMDDFNSSLATELMDHAAVRYERYGTASLSSWRIDEPYLQRSQVFSILIEQIHREIVHYIKQLPGQKHSFIDTKPKRAQLRLWSVFTEHDGFETWHVHQNGWMSGVYYVMVPDSIKYASDNKGCIEFGNPVLDHIPRDIPGERRTIRPRPGRLLLFPSHTFHRTHPTANGQRRLIVAFDVVPMG